MPFGRLHGLRSLVICALLLSGGVACQQRNARGRGDASNAGRWKKTDEAVVETLRKSVRESQGQAGITHAVFFWLKTPGDAAQRRQLIEATYSLRSIAGVNLVSTGTPLPSTRPVVDSSWDVSLVMLFADEVALHAYEQNPQHVKAVTEILRPLTSKILVYDIRNAAPPDAGSKKEAGASAPAPR
jgi:hypothetical protein